MAEHVKQYYTTRAVMRDNSGKLVNFPVSGLYPTIEYAVAIERQIDRNSSGWTQVAVEILPVTLGEKSVKTLRTEARQRTIQVAVLVEDGGDGAACVDGVSQQLTA